MRKNREHSIKSGEFAQQSIHEGHVTQTREPIKIEDTSHDSHDLDPLNNKSYGRSVNARASMITPVRRDQKSNQRAIAEQLAGEMSKEQGFDFNDDFQKKKRHRLSEKQDRDKDLN